MRCWGDLNEMSVRATAAFTAAELATTMTVCVHVCVFIGISLQHTFSDGACARMAFPGFEKP